jgi:2,4-dienoyl-CoA reductase-like NADH-dependent reductase (Old Yellow Enzyme family)
MTPGTHLFSEFHIRNLILKNRIAVSPMCQYSSHDGFANSWHVVHLGSRAVGGAALVMMEATAVEPRGRISPSDMGLWKDEHIDSLRPVVAAIRDHGAVAAIQLAHAGRKASTARPWEGGRVIPPEAENGWLPVAPTAVAFAGGDPLPHELSGTEIGGIVEAFAAAAVRALAAGFEVVEIHGAHGYLIHEFLSPLSNFRTDGYGGRFEGRIRFALEVARTVRQVWPQTLPVFMRLSCTDWVERGWDIAQTVELCKRLREIGIDLIDCSSGGLVPGARIPLGPGYQVPFAGEIRREAKIATGAVGLITKAAQADAVIRDGQADLVLLARAMLRDPYWALHAARELEVKVAPPLQYLRAF